MRRPCPPMTNKEAAMKFLVLMIALLSFSGTVHALESSREIPYADAVPFLGIEDSAKDVKRAVCTGSWRPEQWHD
jgi:hypothetical protein